MNLRFLLLACLASSAFAQTFADLVITNATVWTGDRNQPRAEAVASTGGRIVAVGTAAQVRKWVGPTTKVIDLGGKLVVPGFNDSHVHLYSGGQHLSSVKLREASSDAEFTELIRAHAATLPKGTWILGGDWDHERFTPVHLPTREMIDKVAPDYPVFVNRHDGHMAVANSMALRLAGVTRHTDDPPGGVIVRDAKGEPAGVLKDAAMDLVARVIPAPSEDDITRAVRAAMKEARENGVTSIHDVSNSPATFRVYQKLMQSGELTMRVSAHRPLAEWKRLADTGITAGFGNPFLQLGALKALADGSLGSTTALFFAPYSDAPQTHGIAGEQMIPESKMQQNLLDADRAGLQVAVHAIGDRANDTVLSMFEAVIKQNGPRDRRFRIEHAQHLRGVDIPRFAKLGVIASMQPYHAIDDGRWADKRIGPERAKGTYAFRSLLDAGAVLAFGSDWYVAPLKPLLGIYAAATRRTIDGKRPDGWVPEQKITPEEALRAYTWGSAYASFTEKFEGTIETGKLADFVVVSDNILAGDPVAIEKAHVVMTIFDGKIIYQHP